MWNKLYNGDCLEIMQQLIDKGIKVDAIITDPPYGTTACKWDSVIPFDKMWDCCNNLIKDNGAIVLFGSEPFSSKLRMSNISMYRYDWVWVKNISTGVGNCNKMPMKNNELLSCFYKKLPTYNPQGLKVFNKKMTRGGSAEYMGDKTGIKGGSYIQQYTNYPRTTLMNFKSEKGLHPTQKPIALMEYLVKTYTNEGDTVLDFTMGSGTTGVACKQLNRNFIGIELDTNYFKIAEERINESDLG